MIYKKIIKISLFIILFFILLNIISQIFKQRNMENTSWLEYYQLPDESIEILFLGNSHSLVTFVPALINKELNIDSYSFASNGANLDIVYFRFLEVLKTQNPQIIVIELFSVMSDFDNNQVRKLKWSHAAFDGMKFSENKIRAIQTLFPLNNNLDNFQNQFELFFPIKNYHSNWKDEQLPIYLKRIFSKEMIETYSTSFGFKWLNKIHPDYIMNDSVLNKQNAQTNEVDKISDEKRFLLEEIISICNENNIKIVFVITPFIEQNGISSKDLTKISNGLSNIMLENGIPLINYNLLSEEIGFNYNDLEDDGHVNTVGAFKITNHFIVFLKNMYGDIIESSSYDFIDQTKEEFWIVNKYFEDLTIKQTNYFLK